MKKTFLCILLLTTLVLSGCVSERLVTQTITQTEAVTVRPPAETLTKTVTITPLPETIKVTPPTTTSPVPSGVVTLELFGFSMAKNWDADPGVDGIETQIWPKDAKDEVVKVPGTVSAKLWLQKSWFESEKGELIQTWSGISIKKEDYGFIGGAKVRLQYSGFVPTEGQWGILEVTFTTLDGNSFTAREKDIPLGE